MVELYSAVDQALNVARMRGVSEKASELAHDVAPNRLIDGRVAIVVLRDDVAPKMSWKFHLRGTVTGKLRRRRRRLFLNSLKHNRSPRIQAATAALRGRVKSGDLFLLR